MQNLIKSYKQQDIAYSKVNVESTVSELDDEDVEISITHRVEQYEHALNVSKKSVIRYFVAGTCYSFFHTNRMSIYVLYAEELGSSRLQIALLMYSYPFWCGIAVLLYGVLANKYGYDTMLIMLLLLQAIAVLLEAVAAEFYVLFAGIMLGQIGLIWIILGYIAWILPHKVATKYTSYYYATYVFGYLIGPSSAGFVSYLVSNS